MKQKGIVDPVTILVVLLIIILVLYALRKFGMI